jgi:hypothetical protein
VQLWNLVQQTTFMGDPYIIAWHWTTDVWWMMEGQQHSGNHQVQFAGSYSSFNGSSVWKVYVEGKHKFFACLLVQCKILLPLPLMGHL